MHLRTLCGTRPKQHPLNSKPPAFPPAHDLGTALALNFRVMFYRCSTLSLGVAVYYLLGFIRGLSEASSSGLPPEKPRSVFSPGYGRPGTHLL